jgi:hypothetical protein
MFAIQLSEENVPKILERGFEERDFETYLGLTRVVAFFISGYVDRMGKVHPFGIVPFYILVRDFEFDPEAIKTDWDQIVRKEQTK